MVLEEGKTTAIERKRHKEQGLETDEPFSVLKHWAMQDRFRVHFEICVIRRTKALVMFLKCINISEYPTGASGVGLNITALPLH